MINLAPGEIGIPRIVAAIRSIAQRVGLVRDVFTADRDYYVNASTGNAANPGTLLAPWAHPQDAITYAMRYLDAAGYIMRVNCAAGTYGNNSISEGITLFGPIPGGGGSGIFSGLRFIGDNTTPSNVVISTTGPCVHPSFLGRFSIEGFKLTSSASHCAYSSANGCLEISGKIDWGAAAGDHMQANVLGTIVNFAIGAAYTISGSAGSAHMRAQNGGSIENNGSTITLTGTPNFGDAFAVADGGSIQSGGNTYSGSGTGKRYSAKNSGKILTSTSSETYFPGDVAGERLSGGTYESLATVPLPRSYLSGFETSNNAGTPNTKMDVAAGAARDSTNAFNIVNAASVTIDCTTTGANALDTGSLANATWYHVFAIGKADGTAAALASTSATAPTMPTGYAYKRRIGSFKTDGSAHIVVFIQDGDAFTWSTPLNDVSATNPGTAAVTRTLTVPTGIRVFAVGSVIGNGPTAADSPISCYVSDLSTTDVAANGSTGAAQAAVYNYTAGGFGGSTFGVFTNTSGQIRSRVQASTANTVLYINTTGWVDRRGRDG